MNRFFDRQRVRVVAKDHPLVGRSGEVVRLCMSGRGAWVKMDARLPAHCASFPKGDPRARHAMLDPEECEAIK